MRFDRPEKQLTFVVLLLVTTGVVITFHVPRAPLVPFWLLVSLVGGVWISLDERFESLSVKIHRLLVMYAVLMPAAVLSTQAAARRQATAAHLQYRGVLLEMADSVSIGSGAVNVDIRFPTISPSQLPWRLTLSRAVSGWSIHAPARAELVKIHTDENDSPWASKYRAVNGVLLKEDGDRAEVLSSNGQPADTIVLRAVRGSRWLESTRGRYELDPPAGRIQHRHESALDLGTRLGALHGDRLPDLRMDQLVRVQRVPANHEIDGSVVGWFARLGDDLPGGERRRRILISATAPYRVSDPSRSTPNGYPLGDSTRIEVRHDGGRWAFDVEVRRASAVERQGLSIRFVRNPRPMDTPLPSGENCPENVACGLMSLRRLPPPIPHISLGSAGFDGSRYGVLARLIDRDGRIVAFLPRDSMLVEDESRGSTPIPVEAFHGEGDEDAPEHERPGYAVLVSSSSTLLDQPLPLFWASVGVFSLLLLVVGAVAASTPRASPAAWEERRWALVLGVNSVLSLILVRLVFGARISFFDPYLGAGLATAIGLVVATSIVCLGLLWWTGWAPRTLAFVDAHSPRSAVRAILDHASVAVAASKRRVSPSLLPVAALGLLSAVSILFTSPEALLYGTICGTAVLGVWFAVAWVSAFSAPRVHTFSGSPFEVVQYSEWRGDGPAVFPRSEVTLALMAGLWAIILFSFGVGLIALLLAGLAIFVLDSTGVYRSLPPVVQRGADVLLPALNAKTNLMLAGSTIGVGLIAEFGSNGAVGAFLLVTLLVLLSVRFGRRLASDYSNADRGLSENVVGTFRTLTLVMGPVLLLAPLALIDMGLLLVMVIPIALTPLMALGWKRLRPMHWLAFGVASLLLGLAIVRVLAPNLSALRAPAEAGTELKTERFEDLQRLFGIRPPLIDGSLNRAAARAVGARAGSQTAAEELLLWAKPGPARDLLMPSIEQAWASRAYSASGLLGVGMGEAPVGHGIAETVSYAENTFSVFVLHEHGFLAGVMILLQYGLLAFAVLMILTSTRESRDAQRAGQALFVAGVLIVVIPACYVALANIGVLPITGQNIPFLGLNAWSDVTLCSAVIGVLLMGCMQSEVQGERRSEVAP